MTAVPILGTKASDSSVAEVLLGQVRSALLALLFCRSDREFYLREIVRSVGMGQGAVQRELAQLVRAGLVTRTRKGNQVYYQANRKSPVFAEVRSLMVKTVGIADVLRAGLAAVADGIRVAFIYGSVARGDETSESDVDVMVVGDVTFGEVVSALLPAQEALGREVNPSVYPVGEFTVRVASGDHFLRSVLADRKAFLVGGECELRELGA